LPPKRPPATQGKRILSEQVCACQKCEKSGLTVRSESLLPPPRVTGAAVSVLGIPELLVQTETRVFHELPRQQHRVCRNAIPGRNRTVQIWTDARTTLDCRRHGLAPAATTRRVRPQCPAWGSGACSGSTICRLFVAQTPPGSRHLGPGHARVAIVGRVSPGGINKDIVHNGRRL
jgi:hypothetical protein